MIIIGYPGVGKSTLASKLVWSIDLESTCFKYKGEHIDHWWEPYCKVAEHLSQQGYDVYVSSHKAVRDKLKVGSEYLVAVVPDLSLESRWIDKLYARYEETESAKDLAAYNRAKEHFAEDIKAITDDIEHVITITHMQYNLELLMHKYRRDMYSESL